MREWREKVENSERKRKEKTENKKCKF